MTPGAVKNLLFLIHKGFKTFLQYRNWKQLECCMQYAVQLTDSNGCKVFDIITFTEDTDLKRDSSY